MSQDRDLVEEERQQRLAARADDRPGRASAVRGGMDAGTRTLAFVAGGLGGVLVLMVGGWSLLGHRPAGVPILSPPPGPVRVKPIDPGGMQLMSPQVAQTDTTVQALAPGPEQAAPQALQAEVDKAREADRPAAATPPLAASVPPAQPSAVFPASAPAAAPVPAPTATPASLPRPAAEASRTDQSAPDQPAPDQPAPDQPAADQPTADQPAANQPAPLQPAVNHPAIGQHAVQLAALDSAAAARTEWDRLSRRAPSVFAGHAPVISGITRGSKQFFRLRTGGFATTADATAFCARAKQAGIACTLADF